MRASQVTRQSGLPSGVHLMLAVNGHRKAKISKTVCSSSD